MAYPSAGEILGNMNALQQLRMTGSMGGGADALAGGLLARGSAIGSPILSGAMGMMGLDPMSIGMKAGMGAWNMGAGVMGAGLAGGAAMAGVGMVGLGAHFVGSQMMTGAQQQLGLNTSLRNNFNFVNAQGGMGFTSHQGFQIGNQLRGMTHEMGPSGEIATFGELSKLAANMGRMGMAQNVRTVADFKDKFKEMVDTLKKVATDMGSSLEEAQKFVNSMKGSGIFRQADQLRMSHGTRLTAAAGGLAMSEVTGMSNIGSQIARSVGGLGRQGAFAGMKTIEQIGLAQRVGAINEEDIYNATGLTGAEGRQAMATAQLQQSAHFLSGGRGRRFLASIAGKDGTLNEQAVMEYMMGGNVTTGRTMELAHQNLEGVGRANFIRNEGRLRGAALEKFGGLAQSLVYKQWLSSRGYDPTSMDDKSMLAFQRFSGMGRDEADLAIKQIQRLPEMLQEKRMAQDDVAYSDAVAKYNKTTGIEGFRRQFNQSREKIQGHLQQAGSDILAGSEDMVASWFNKVMGVYERRQVEGVDRIRRMMKTGDSSAKAEMERMFAGGSNLKGLGGVGASHDFGGNSLMGALQIGDMKDDVGSVTATGADKAFGDANRGALRAGIMGAADKRGLERADAIMAATKGMKGSEAYAEEYKKADAAGKLKIAERLSQAAGFDAGSMAQTVDADSLNLNDAGSSKFERYLGIGKDGATLGEVERMTGEGMIGREGKGMHEAKKAAGVSGGGLLATAVLGPLGGLVGVAKGVSDFFGEREDSRAAGAFMRSEKGSAAINAIFEGGKAAEEAENRVHALRTKASGGELSRDEGAELKVLQTAQAARALGAVAKGRKPEDLSEAEKKKVEEEASKVIGRPVSYDEVVKGAGSIKGALGAKRADAVRQMSEMATSDVKGLREELTSTGVATLSQDGKLALSSSGPLKKGDVSDLAVELANMKFEGTTDQKADALRKEASLRSQMNERIQGLSIEEKRKLAKEHAGDMTGSLYAASAGREERLRGQIKRYGGGQGKGGDLEAALGGLLGADIDKDLRKKLEGGSAEGVASVYAAQLGITGGGKDAEEFKKKLAEGVKAAREGKMGVAADLFSQAEGGATGDVKKKLEEARDAKMGPAERSAKSLKNIEDAMTKAVAALGEINTKTKGADHPDGSGNGSPGATQPGQTPPK